MRLPLNVERRIHGTFPARGAYPYRGWDANGTVYHISRPSSGRTGWHAWGTRDRVALAGDLIAAPTLSALAAKLAAHKPPVSRAA